MKNEQTTLNLRLSVAQQQLAELHTTAIQAATYRHDLHHHLSLIGGFASTWDIGTIKDYLALVQGELDAINPMRYCENETINLILIAFDHKAR